MFYDQLKYFWKKKSNPRREKFFLNVSQVLIGTEEIPNKIDCGCIISSKPPPHVFANFFLLHQLHHCKISLWRNGNVIKWMCADIWRKRVALDSARRSPSWVSSWHCRFKVKRHIFLQIKNRKCMQHIFGSNYVFIRCSFLFYDA